MAKNIRIVKKGVVMSEFTIDEKNKLFLYHLYQLDWMTVRGYSIMKMIHSISDYAKDAEENDFINLYMDWQYDAGFDGSLWVDYVEFTKTEFLKTGYICKLIAKLMEKDKYNELMDWYIDYHNKHRELNWS